MTHDKTFEQWANKVWMVNAGLGAEISLKDFRKDVILEIYNEAGQLAITYTIYRCWVRNSPPRRSWMLTQTRWRSGR